MEITPTELEQVRKAAANEQVVVPSVRARQPRRAPRARAVAAELAQLRAVQRAARALRAPRLT